MVETTARTALAISRSTQRQLASWRYIALLRAIAYALANSPMSANRTPAEGSFPLTIFLVALTPQS